MDKFIEVAEKLRTSGYRPTRVRVWSLPEPQALAANTNQLEPQALAAIPQNGLLIKTLLAPAARIQHTRLAPAAQVSAGASRVKVKNEHCFIERIFLE